MAGRAQTVSYLDQESAINVDVDLMSTPGFSIDQLMELAGLSCACAAAECAPTPGCKVRALLPHHRSEAATQQGDST